MPPTSPCYSLTIPDSGQSKMTNWDSKLAHTEVGRFQGVTIWLEWGGDNWSWATIARERLGTRLLEHTTSSNGGAYGSVSKDLDRLRSPFAELIHLGSSKGRGGQNLPTRCTFEHQKIELQNSANQENQWAFGVKFEAEISCLSPRPKSLQLWWPGPKRSTEIFLKKIAKNFRKKNVVHFTYASFMSSEKPQPFSYIHQTA